jgi:hypothetical protein
MNNIYGVTNHENVHTDISTSLKATKIYATKNNHDKISIRYNCGYIAKTILKKEGKKWVDIN